MACSNLEMSVEAMAEGIIQNLRCELKGMTLVHGEIETTKQEKESELQMVRRHLRQVAALLKHSEDCQRKLEDGIRHALAILEHAADTTLASAEVAIQLAEGIGRKSVSKACSRKMRKPHTPFLLWVKDKRREACDAHPTASIADLFAIMLEEWDTIPEEDKNRYVELHRALCEKHKLRVAAHSNLNETDQKTLSDDLNIKQKTVSDDLNIKQKAMSLLGQYLASKKTQPTVTGTEVSPETSVSSTNGEANSAPGEAGSSSDSTLSVNQDSNWSVNQQLEFHHLSAAREDPSAYLLFSMEQRKKLPLDAPDMTHCQMNATIAQLWRELSHEEKRNWHELAIPLQNKHAPDDETMPDLECIPVGLKIEKPSDNPGILEKNTFSNGEDEGSRGIQVPLRVCKVPIWEQLGSSPVSSVLESDHFICNPDCSCSNISGNSQYQNDLVM